MFCMTTLAVLGNYLALLAVSSTAYKSALMEIPEPMMTRSFSPREEAANFPDGARLPERDALASGWLPAGLAG